MAAVDVEGSGLQQLVSTTAWLAGIVVAATAWWWLLHRRR
jgi:hypothetical protein